MACYCHLVGKGQGHCTDPTMTGPPLRKALPIPKSQQCRLLESHQDSPPTLALVLGHFKD